MRDMYAEASNVFQNLVIEQLNTLTEEEKKEIEADLLALTKKLKMKNSHPFSITTALVAILSAMYYERYDESPAETVIQAHERNSSEERIRVRSVGKLYIK